MKTNIKKIYCFEIVLLTVLVICAFFLSSYTKFILAIITFIGAIVSSFVLKKEPTIFTNKKKVLKVMIIFALLYLALFYVFGIYVGFYKTVNKFSIRTILMYILPITITVISTEKIRYKLLSINNKMSKLLALIITVLIDIYIYMYIYNLNNMDDFLTVIGFQIFSSLSVNILYNYLSPRYGEITIIAYKLITTLYLYIIPIVPDLYIFFRTFIRMIFPLIIYEHVDNRYNPDKEIERPIVRKREIISMSITFAVLTMFICLISCKFTYGALVIGSGSMTGSINKGDVVIFKNNKKVLEGDVIVFQKDNIKVVHRVVKISSKKNNTIYYTKGDANPNIDADYVTDENILGNVLFKIKYIGKPTIWLREQFN